MSLKIAICDDEKNEARQIQSAVENWAKAANQRIEIAEFPSAEAFLFQYQENNSFDILLLDVSMTGESGIDLAKRLRLEGNRAEIIFITSHFEFYGEGYEVDALHYLLKPVDEAKLSAALTKAAERIAVAPPAVIIKCDGETVKIFESEISYVEAFLHYIVIHTKKREYKIKENLSDFAEKLSEDFYRTHRSYLVSLKQIVRIGKASVTVEGGTELPLARGKYDEVNRAYIRRN